MHARLIASCMHYIVTGHGFRCMGFIAYTIDHVRMPNDALITSNNE